HPAGRAEQQPDALEKAPSAALTDQPASPGTRQRPRALRRPATGLPDSCLTPTVPSPRSSVDTKELVVQFGIP
ncbi:hypothetical protein E2320_022781, partial [Naja naja]